MIWRVSKTRDSKISWSLPPVAKLEEASIPLVQLMCNPMSTANCVDCEATESGMLLVNTYVNAKSIKSYS